ncbi:T9SS type A sorting domain-containing protein [uncultured Flavobacterium sp.]|uniref:DUF7619 domain-containing protein n=1 Tax=uncultured Flavobacterium sp. TaxID=165435 RepID=UPI0025F29C06|nr:T9SS type A sorting domain-containing protein [uncultured Flavobacterium sp.]
MKKQLLFLMLLLTGMAGAQIVNIPDAAFKAKLLEASASNMTARNSLGQQMAIDANNDNEIQVSEALAVWQLRVDSDDIVSVAGIEAFANLRVLNIAWATHLTSLSITGLTALEELYLDGIDVLATINCAGLPNLRKIISPTETTDLMALDCTGLVSLEEIRLANCFGLASLQIASLPSLKKVNIGYNYGLTSLDLTGLENLEELVCLSDNITTVTTGSLPALEKLRIESFVLGSLDLSGCPLLNNFRFFGVLDYLNLKNGATTYTDFDFDPDGADFSFICIDEGEESYFAEAVGDNPNILLSTYCSFTPGGDYNIIEGAFTFDAANNGCGSGSTLNRNVKTILTDGIHTFTTFSNNQGEYKFYVPAGTFTLMPDMENSWFTITPPSATINLPTVNNGTTTQNFCIAPVGVHPDVEVLVWPIGGVQPGFDATYKLVYFNKGNQALSGAVTLNYDDSVLDYVSATPVEAASSTGSLSWNYANLMPFESRSIYIELNLNGPMEIPAVNLGDQLYFTASITPTAGDETPADNTFATTIEVVGSYDPNDITCLEGSSVHPDKIGEYLHYNINFENTGTAPATFIVVKDVIDETKFDLSSFQMIEASHDVEVRLTGNKAEFMFDAINLAPAGKGNVVFKIKTLNTLQVNDDVSQQANIYFDYNWPIETNEATTVFEVLGRGDFEKDHSVKVYPNPAKNILNISADSEVKSVEMYDVQGRLLETGIVNDMNTTIDLTARQAGMYFVKVTTEKGVKIEKVIRE